MSVASDFITADSEMIGSIVERQLDLWPEAKRNFDGLMDVRRREVPVGDFKSCVQFNPGRIRSTAAKVDTSSIRERPCFLCSVNRPKEQMAISCLDNWELLVNPFPILPVHFTIASTIHRPQARIPVEMASMAERMPDLLFFFNGARAGASAPDHMHCQAVLSREVPLVRLVESCHSAETTSFTVSTQWNLSLPFHFFSAVIGPGEDGMKLLNLMTRISGIDSSTGQPDPGLVNAFFWIDPAGLLRIVVIPRRAHRPVCYGDGEGKLLVSPGALDMAGIVVTPRPEDYNSITTDLLANIYAQVAFADDLPDIRMLLS